MEDLRDDACLMQSDPKKDNNEKCSKSVSNHPPPNAKWKLSNVKSLNAKALECHLENLKFAGDSTLDMTLLHSNIVLLMHVGTDGIVETPQFDYIDE